MRASQYLPTAAAPKPRCNGCLRWRQIVAIHLEKIKPGTRADRQRKPGSHPFMRPQLLPVNQRVTFPREPIIHQARASRQPSWEIKPRKTILREQTEVIDVQRIAACAGNQNLEV
jgi:hypothetical protein